MVQLGKAVVALFLVSCAVEVCWGFHYELLGSAQLPNLMASLRGKNNGTMSMVWGYNPNVTWHLYLENVTVGDMPASDVNFRWEVLSSQVGSGIESQALEVIWGNKTYGGDEQFTEMVMYSVVPEGETTHNSTVLLRHLKFPEGPGIGKKEVKMVWRFFGVNEVTRELVFGQHNNPASIPFATATISNTTVTFPNDTAFYARDTAQADKNVVDAMNFAMGVMNVNQLQVSSKVEVQEPNMFITVTYSGFNGQPAGDQGYVLVHKNVAAGLPFVPFLAAAFGSALSFGLSRIK